MICFEKQAELHNSNCRLCRTYPILRFVEIWLATILTIQVNQSQRTSLSMTLPSCCPTCTFSCCLSIYFSESKAALALLAVNIMQSVYLVRMDYCDHCKAQSTHVHVYRYSKIEHLNSLENQMPTFFSKVKHYLGVNFCFTGPWEMYIAEKKGLLM